VSLQGTFDTLSVTELFGLLATAGKTGALRLEAGEHEATLLVRAGRCCAVDDGAAVSVGSEAQLGARLVDIGFTLAREAEGSFRFSEGDVAEAEVTVPFEPAVAEITAMVEAWKDIEATIPSLEVRLRLAAALPADDQQIVIRAAEWALLARLPAQPTVRELVAALGEPLLDVCRRAKDLVDRGAIEVAVATGTPVAAGAAAEATPAPAPDVAPEPAAPRDDPLPPVETRPPDARHRPARDRSALHEATAQLLDPTEPYAPEAVEPETAEAAGAREPVAVAADRKGGDGEEPSADRGALLRLFSALKE
jgi:Domain of unknown function (DUF4388)